MNYYDFRLDFDTAVLAGPDTDGDCGTANDEFSITSPSTTIPGVASLCGTLSGQHSKNTQRAFALKICPQSTNSILNMTGATY